MNRPKRKKSCMDYEDDDEKILGVEATNLTRSSAAAAAAKKRTKRQDDQSDSSGLSKHQSLPRTCVGSHPLRTNPTNSASFKDDDAVDGNTNSTEKIDAQAKNDADTATAKAEWDTMKSSAMTLSHDDRHAIAFADIYSSITTVSFALPLCYRLWPNAISSGVEGDSGLWLVLCASVMTESCRLHMISTANSCSGSAGVSNEGNGMDVTVLTPQVATVLQQMQGDPDVRHVELNGGPRGGHESIFRPILRVILKAVAMNLSIQEFGSRMCYFPLALLTEYLATKPLLKGLKLKSYVTESSSDDGSALHEEVAAARAIAALPTLTSLAVPAEEAFLEALQSHPTLLHLVLHFERSHYRQNLTPNPFLLSNVLKTCTHLHRVELGSLRINVERWTGIASGLRAHPSIVTLILHRTFFTKKATALFLAHFRSTDPSCQPVCVLHLVGVVFETYDRSGIGEDLAHMLRGSLLREISLRRFFVADVRDTIRFFNVLSAHSSEIHLQTMKLEMHSGTYTRRDMQQHVTRFLATNRHLRHFAVTLVHYTRPRSVATNLFVPRAFLRSVRRNTSLHSVNIKDYNCADRNQPQDFPDQQVRGFLQAVMERNCNLPRLITTALVPAAAAPVSTVDSATVAQAETHSTATATPNLFPTLCMEAQQMEPNVLLKGLQTVGCQDEPSQSVASIPSSKDE